MITNDNKDKIVIHKLRIFANHGVLAEEKSLGQVFVVSLELGMNLKKAGRSDLLSATVSYAEVCERVEAIFRERSFDLIESAALYVVETLLEEYNAFESIKIILEKPWAPIKKDVESVGVIMERKWHKVYLGLGSNLGDKKENMNEAMKRIDGVKGCRLMKSSKVIETEPWGGVEQDNYLNSVLLIDTYLDPHELLEEMQSIEYKLKRERKVKWGPRTIDIDILLYDREVINEEDLIIPHPYMCEREFVLKPLTEIAPFIIHPVKQKNMMELLKELDLDE